MEKGCRETTAAMTTITMTADLLDGIKTMLDDYERQQAVLCEVIACAVYLTREIEQLRAELAAEQQRNGPSHCPACGRDLRKMNGRRP